MAQSSAVDDESSVDASAFALHLRDVFEQVSNTQHKLWPSEASAFALQRSEYFSSKRVPSAAACLGLDCACDGSHPTRIYLRHALIRKCRCYTLSCLSSQHARTLLYLRSWHYRSQQICRSRKHLRSSEPAAATCQALLLLQPTQPV